MARRPPARSTWRPARARPAPSPSARRPGSSGWRLPARRRARARAPPAAPRPDLSRTDPSRPCTREDYALALALCECQRALFSIPIRWHSRGESASPPSTEVHPHMKLKPLGDRLIVRAIEEEETTASGIVLPDTAKEKPQRGEVIAVGDGRFDDDGDKRIPLDVSKGDTVLYSKYGGTEIKVDGEDLLVLRESDVLAKVEK